MDPGKVAQILVLVDVKRVVVIKRIMAFYTAHSGPVEDRSEWTRSNHLIQENARILRVTHILHFFDSVKSGGTTALLRYSRELLYVCHPPGTGIVRGRGKGEN